MAINDNNKGFVLEFDFFVSQNLYFGPGKLSQLPDLAGGYGRTLLAAAIRENITVLMAQDPWHPALEKYAWAGGILAGRAKDMDRAAGCRRLMDLLDDWTGRFNMPRRSVYGVTPTHIGSIVDAAGQKNNPVHLSGDGMKRILEIRL